MREKNAFTHDTGHVKISAFQTFSVRFGSLLLFSYISKWYHCDIFYQRMSLNCACMDIDLDEMQYCADRMLSYAFTAVSMDVFQSCGKLIAIVCSCCCFHGCLSIVWKFVSMQCYYDTMLTIV